jgi:hypothetical protein
MPAKAMVPVEALPCIDRFRGHGPLLQTFVDASPAVGMGQAFVGAGHARLSGRWPAAGLPAGCTNKGRAPCISPR